MSGNQMVYPRKFKFFRVLLQGFSSELSIPREFTKYFIEENSSWATILSPLGKAWHVKVHGDSKSLHFADGWENFSAAHKLSTGDFLVFKYKGSLVFDVSIFDRSTCERDYSATNGLSNDGVHFQEENHEREFESPSCGKRTPAVSDRAPNKYHSDGPEEQAAQKQYCKTKKATKGSKRGSCFSVTIKAYHKYSLVIPAHVTQSGALSNVHQLLLRDPKGNLWPVDVKHYASPKKRSFFVAGWREFRISHSLGKGDVCLFEHKEKNEMHVQIHRGGMLNSMKSPKDDSRKFKKPLYRKTTIELMKTSQLMEAGLQFKSTMIPINFHRKAYLNIPKSFVSSVDLSAIYEAVLVDGCSRRWPVKICHRKPERVWMGLGWQDFRDANNVKVGDVCIFTFKSGLREATFEVEVIKYEGGAQ